MAGEIGRKTDHWGSRFGFIMAAVGSSVGLGNFWRFPFTAGENGGGAFIIIYLFCVLFLGLTVLMAEYALGRKSGMSAIEGIHSLARAENKSENWQVVGWIGSLGAFFILTFYIVISAWVLAFIPQAFGGTFNGFAAEAARLTAETGTTVSIADVSASNFGETISNKYVIGGLLASFLLTNVFVVARGVKGGIEKAATVLMPAFFILLIGIVGFALVEGDAGAAADFLLTPDFSEVTMGTFLEAVGQAFFSLGAGMGVMITYGVSRLLSDDYLWRLSQPRYKHSACFGDRGQRGYDGGADCGLRDLPDCLRIWRRPCGRSRPVLCLHADCIQSDGRTGRLGWWRFLPARSVCGVHVIHLLDGSWRGMVGRT